MTLLRKTGALLLVLLAPHARAQSSGSATYVAVSAGVAIQQEVLGVRSPVGLAVAAAFGVQSSAHLAIEARLGGAMFPAPMKVTPPSGCFMVVPCIIPDPGPTRAATLGVSGRLSGNVYGVEPFLTAGGGARLINQGPEYSGELRPYGEFGAGLAGPIGKRLWNIDVRVQLAPVSNIDLARFMIPITAGVRF